MKSILKGFEDAIVPAALLLVPCLMMLLLQPVCAAIPPIEEETTIECVLEESVAVVDEVPEVAVYVPTEHRTPVTMHGNSSAKTYMDYKMITSVNSPQWQYIYKSGEVMVCEDGLIRSTDGLGYIGVALGSYFGDIGSRYIFTLDSGEELKVVKVEAKNNIHTDSLNYAALNGSVIEFVVETNFMRDHTYKNGYIYGGNFNNCDDFKGHIVSIEKVEIY